QQDPAPPAPAAARGAAAGWDEVAAALPRDWSDLWCQVHVLSTDDASRAALALGPVNPARPAGAPIFRFRVARSFGYGASPGLVRRCLERLDEGAIRARVEVLRVLCDTRPVGTQGPVWYVDGKAV